MHSSRMHTARLLSVSGSIPVGWVGCPGDVRREVCRGGGCPGVVSRMVHLGGVCPGGCVRIPACNGVDTTTPVNRIKDRCRNITLPQTSFAGGNIILSENEYSLCPNTIELHHCTFSRIPGDIHRLREVFTDERSPR